MNSADVNSLPVGLNVFDPQNLGELQDVKSAAIKTLQESFRVVGNFSATGTQSSAQGTGLPDLESPSLSKQVNDLTLRIGLLQDALNRLVPAPQVMRPTPWCSQSWRLPPGSYEYR